MKIRRIEQPRGETYQLNGFGVYDYDQYPHDSVLAGQERRRFVGVYKTLIEAVRACGHEFEIDQSISAAWDKTHGRTCPCEDCREPGQAGDRALIGGDPSL